jgi:glycosyltransferase involved in cell wall biosynthesis
MTWQEFMGKYLHKNKYLICIAGTHGKSTTTTMAGLLLEQAGLAEELAVVVLTPKGEAFSEQRPSPSLSLHPTSSASRYSYLSDAYRIANAILAEEKSDEWLITTQDPFLVGALGYLLSRKHKVPLHLQLHTDPWSEAWRSERLRNRIEYLIMRFLLTKAAGVRVVSERVRRAVIAAGYPASEVTKVPIHVDVAKFRDGSPQFDLHKSYPTFSRIVLSIGRLQPEKNYARLIKAFAAVHKVHDDAMLLIVGSGPERERLSVLVRTLGIEKAVVLLPWARDVVSYYKTSDLYVQPSRYEGWGMAIVEAMAAGLPVVMTDVGCAGEIVRNEETGLVVPVDDEKALALAIMRLLEDTQLRTTLPSAV